MLALVTAGSRRLGRELVLKLADLGYDIALHYNSSQDAAEKTADEVRRKGRNCEIFQRHFHEIDAVRTLMAEVIERMREKPSLLINNASTFESNTLKTATPEEFDNDFNVHLKAPLFLSQDFANQCGKGQIVNIVDTCITRTGSTYWTYMLSKKALYELTRMSAKELAPDIRVNAIAPGIILPAVGWSEEKSDAASKRNLMKSPSGPADVIMALEYLLRAEQVTGECLFVDGGDHVDL